MKEEKVTATDEKVGWVLQAVGRKLPGGELGGVNWNHHKRSLEVAVTYQQRAFVCSVPERILAAGKDAVVHYVLSSDMGEDESEKPRRNPGREEFFKRSGGFVTSCRLTAFLYGLLRDHVTAGTVELVMENTPRHDSYSLTNGWLAAHANDIAERLTSPHGVLAMCAQQLEDELRRYALEFAQRTKQERAESREAVMNAADRLRRAVEELKLSDEE